MASNKTLVPEAKEALERFKMEAASEVGVNLKQGYNGDLTSKQAGSVGGQMVKKMTPTRLLIFKRPSRIKRGHKVDVKYEFCLMA
ncbi:MAG: alpha/beta-type small acid-soluble spore protein [Ruminococcaceae bacterium]|nr:alpha/beta-type small acid-soluble spore protein [Oscillospiraceae bacterium]